MIKKTIAYTDYNGNERIEDAYFNLSKAEIMEMEMSVVGGLTEMIKNISEAEDTPALFKIFKEVILKAYGKKSPDGKRFIKSPELREEFEQTEAFSSLLMEFVTNDKAAADFFNGIIPTM